MNQYGTTVNTQFLQPPIQNSKLDRISVLTSVIDLLLQSGLPNMNLNIACGIAGNMDVESEFNYTASGNNWSSYGLLQWSGKHLSKLISYCNENNLSYASIEGQVKFLVNDLKTTFSYVYTNISSGSVRNDVNKVTMNFCMLYNKPNYGTASCKERIVNSQRVMKTYENIKNNGGHTPTTIDDYLTFTANSEKATVGFVFEGGEEIQGVNLQYSRDFGKTWNNYTISNETSRVSLISLIGGETVKFKGLNQNGLATDETHYTHCVMTGTISASGDITSLINNEGGNIPLPNYSFVKLFSNCTSLTKAPKLPSSTLATRCYEYLFNGCSSLTTAPDLPALITKDHCYTGMFQDCTALITAPELPATTLNQSCYRTMFKGCTSLVTPPSLTAISLTISCYHAMFQGCTSLITAPELPATALITNCYYSMFYGCTSLTSSPLLPAENLVDGCYKYMFYDCSSLSNIKALFTTTPSNTYTQNWVNGVAASGTFIKNNSATWDVTGTNGVPNGWSSYKEMEVEYFNIENISQQENVVSIIKSDASAPTIKVYKSTDSTTWEEMGDTSTTALTATIPVNGRLYLKATANAWATSSSVYNSITCSSNFNVCGNIMSLSYGDEFIGEYDLKNSAHTFNHLFNNNNKLINSNNLVLPATKLINYCYAYMFNNCTALVTTPVLPAITMYYECYYYMFYNCTSLTTAPALPATTLANYCYFRMFQNCTSLTTAPELPATTLADYCYSRMFQNCTALTTAPELPATTLADYCYQRMFQGCTALTTASELPATTLTPYCYGNIFNGCTSLNNITCLATDISAEGCTENWVTNVSSSGTFTKEMSMIDWTTGVSGIPSGWTINNVNNRHAQKYDAVYYDSQNNVRFINPDAIASSLPSDYQKLGVVSFVDNDGEIGILPANAASITAAKMMDVYIWTITEKSTATGWMTDGNSHTSTIKLNNYTSSTAFTWQTSTLSDFSTAFNTYLTTYMNGSSFSGLEYHTYTDSDNVFLVLDTYSANPTNNDIQYFTLMPDIMVEIAGNVSCPAPYLECGQQKRGLWNFNRFSVWGLNNQSSTSYSPKTNIDPSDLPAYPIVYPAYIGQSWCDDGTQVKTENNNWVDYAYDLRVVYGEGMEGWYNYLHAMEIDDDSTLGARQPQFVDSVANTNNLASGTYIDKNGVEQSRYPAIMKAYNYGFAGVEGCESGDWGMMSLGVCHKYLGEIKYGYGGTGSSDRTIDPINATLYKMGGDVISCAVYRWLSSRANGTYGWLSRNSGVVYSSYFYNAYVVLPVLLYQEQ